MDTINALRARADEVDEISGETTPKRDLILKELDTAEQILKDGTVQKVISIDTSVSKKYDSHITFSSGLNAWQPLGTAALAGEKVIIYVGDSGNQPETTQTWIFMLPSTMGNTAISRPRRQT